MDKLSNRNINRQKYRKTGRRLIERQASVQTDIQKYGQIFKQTWTDKNMERQGDKWKDMQASGQTDEQEQGQTNRQVDQYMAR